MYIHNVRMQCLQTSTYSINIYGYICITPDKYLTYYLVFCQLVGPAAVSCLLLLTVFTSLFVRFLSFACTALYLSLLHLSVCTVAYQRSTNEGYR